MCMSYTMIRLPKLVLELEGLEMGGEQRAENKVSRYHLAYLLVLLPRTCFLFPSIPLVRQSCSRILRQNYFITQSVSKYINCE